MKREKPGRKPVQDKAIPVTVYVKKSSVEKSGGKSALRDRIRIMVESIING